MSPQPPWDLWSAHPRLTLWFPGKERGLRRKAPLVTQPVGGRIRSQNASWAWLQILCSQACRQQSHLQEPEPRPESASCWLGGRRAAPLPYSVDVRGH